MLKFGKDFIFGAATSAYQIEGAFDADGKGESIWDRFTHFSGQVTDNANGDIACDHYNRYKEDIRLMAEMGLESYRFSVSWARVMPDGTGKVNEKGLQFYINLVDELCKHNIKPMLTLYHWDLPQKLSERGGWLNEESIGWFTEYARVIFETFREKVPLYLTFNEPFVFTHFGYQTGSFAPALKDEKSKLLAAHNVLKAHGSAVKLFRQLGVKSQIGITLDYAPNLNDSDSKEDIAAAELTNEFWAGWFYEPVVLGAYPSRAKKWFEDRKMLPKITAEDEALIAEPIDFLGINNYFANYVKYDADNTQSNSKLVYRDYQKNSMGWPITEDGFYQMLKYFQRTLKVPLYITENGIPLQDKVCEDGKIRDFDRIDFITRYLKKLKQAKDEGLDVRGYYYWSLMDNFEWASGYGPRFGLIHIDYKTQKRTVKESGWFYKEIIKNKQ